MRFLESIDVAVVYCLLASKLRIVIRLGTRWFPVLGLAATKPAVAIRGKLLCLPSSSSWPCFAKLYYLTKGSIAILEMSASSAAERVDQIVGHCTMDYSGTLKSPGSASSSIAPVPTSSASKTDRIAHTTLECDYLVVGLGMGGLAFVDTLLTSHPSATAVIVERRDRPGGHWIVSYPFVKLHQPSVLYGVDSLPLGSDRIEETGFNAGMLPLASVTEILAHYEQAVKERFLPSGRVTFLMLHEWDWSASVARNLISGETISIKAKKRVNTAHETVEVPIMRPPPFPVSTGITCIPPNFLPSHPNPTRFTILGTGKTAVDALLWLLDHGCPPSKVTWVIPRDTWFENRFQHQPAPAFRQSAAAFGRKVANAIMDATSLDDALLRLEDGDILFRLDKNVMPKMFHGATITAAELAAVRQVTDIVRLGHVLEITPEGMRMEGGFKPMPRGTVYVDCTANGLRRRTVPTKVFQGDLITLRPLYAMLVAFSAALTARVEVMYTDEQVKNELCAPAPFSDAPGTIPRRRLARCSVCR